MTHALPLAVGFFIGFGVAGCMCLYAEAKDAMRSDDARREDEPGTSPCPLCAGTGRIHRHGRRGDDALRGLRAGKGDGRGMRPAGAEDSHSPLSDGMGSRP